MATLLPRIHEIYLRIGLLLHNLAEDSEAISSLNSRINSNPGIPVSNPTTSFWTQSPPFPYLVDARSETMPTCADIVIIGSGITGASIARTLLSELSALGLNKRVVMLEARQFCNGATGRNGGHIKCTPHESFSEYKERFGLERARTIVKFQTSHLEVLVNLAKEEGWDAAEAREVETLDVFYDEDAWEENKRIVVEYRQGMPKEAKDVLVWEGAQAREKYKLSEHAYGAITYRAGAIWPYRFVSHVLDSILKTYPSNFSLETHTSVTRISTSPNPSQPYIVHTSRGDIATTHVIHATNAHASSLIPGLRGKLFPVRGTMSAQRPGKSFLDLDGSRSWCFINKKGYEYITQRPGRVDSVDGMGGEIMAGGGLRQAGWGGFEEFGIAGDDKVDYMPGCHLSGVLPMGFGGGNWGEDSPGGRVKGIWSGSLGFTADTLPFVGRLESSLTGRTPVKTSDESPVGPLAEPGEWISAGYSGEGMVNAWLCGVALSLMLLGREELVASDALGMPQGNVDEWFPKEYLCTQERVESISVYKLLETW